MAKWWENVKRVKWSNAYNEKRMLNSFDMAEAKRAESIANSQIKRGEREAGNYRTMYVCSCGVSGCIGVTDGTTTKGDHSWRRN